MCGIAWCGFSWEALATLLAAVIAVGGAAFVATRQVSILRNQVELERLKLRADLFDRRMAVYETTVRWFREIVAKDNVPTPELDREFIDATRRAVFLFRPEVSAKLNEWRDLGVDWETHRHSSDGAIEAGNVKKLLFAAFRSVNDLFEPEMGLAGH